MRFYGKSVSILSVIISLACLFYYLLRGSVRLDATDLCIGCAYNSGMTAFEIKPGEDGSFELSGNYSFDSIPQEITFYFGTYGINTNEFTSHLVLRAIDGQECFYKTKSNYIHDNAEFYFKLEKCPKSIQLSGRFFIRLESNQLRQLAVWGFPNSTGSKAFMQLCFSEACIGGVKGRLINGKSILVKSIAERLSWLWGLEQWILIAAIIAASIIILLGVVIHLTFNPNQFIVGISFFLISFGIGQLFCWLTPPLQAPDEADHLLTAAHLIRSDRLPNEMDFFAKRIHFERIKFRTDEKFLDEHKEKPFHLSWGDHVSAVDMESRSALTWRLWSFLKPSLQSFSIEELLLILRLINCFIFSLTVFLLSLIFYREFANLFFAVPMYLFPSIYFFSTVVSDHSLLTAFQFLFIAMSLALVLKPQSRIIFGSWILSASIVFLTSRAGVPALIFFPLLAFLPQINSGFYGLKITLNDYLFRLFFVAISIFVFQSVLTSSYISGMFGPLFVHIQYPVITSVLRILIDTLTNRNLLLIGPLMYCAIGFLIEKKARNLRSIGLFANKFAPFLLGFYLIGSLLLPYITANRNLPNIEVERLHSPLIYAGKALNISGGFLNFGHHDFYGVLSFFGGYGWLETLSSQFYVSLLISVLILGMFLSIQFAFQRGDKNESMSLITLIFGGLASLVINALANYSVPQNLHGRYLIGFYILMGFICSVGFRTVGNYFLTPRVSFSHILVTFSAINYFYVFWLILNRYF